MLFSVLDTVIKYLTYYTSLPTYDTEPEQFRFKTVHITKSLSVTPKEGVAIIYVLMCRLSGGNYENANTSETVTLTKVHKNKVPNDVIFYEAGDETREKIDIGYKDPPVKMNLNFSKDLLLGLETSHMNYISRHQRAVLAEHKLHLNNATPSVDIQLNLRDAADSIEGLDDLPGQLELLTTMLTEFTGVSGLEGVEEIIRLEAFIKVYRTLASYDTDIYTESKTGALEPLLHARYAAAVNQVEAIEKQGIPVCMNAKVFQYYPHKSTDIVRHHPAARFSENYKIRLRSRIDITVIDNGSCNYSTGQYVSENV